ncbi:YitT family protein [Cohnella sp. AR92]|uniref:YitT family protein n=1 Tax=Cohnella sp. AR92 TaxID=648716 RepID=UPI000F8EF31B|nr:YitT family protein [Cohnella sp. AR92]RUS45713.1 YitT family protein [Cohnella sp. AR92]
MNAIKLFASCLVMGFGILVLHQSHVGTGGTIGLALSTSYWLDFPFYLTYILINVPFFLLSFFAMGRSFTLSSLAAILLLSAISSVTGTIPALDTPVWFGTVFGSVLCGIGMSLLFMCKSSLGGTTILVLLLQKTYGWNPGIAMFSLDVLVVLSSWYTIGWEGMIYSAVSVAIISFVVNLYKNKIAKRLTQEKEIQAPLHPREA